jgi:putative ABC transport system permease protein
VAILLTRDLAGPVVIGSLLAVPVAWYAADQWLHGFAARTDLPWWLFVWAGVAITLVAFAAAGAQSLRAALANPADSLRHD